MKAEKVQQLIDAEIKKLFESKNFKLSNGKDELDVSLLLRYMLVESKMVEFKKNAALTEK